MKQLLRNSIALFAWACLPALAAPVAYTIDPAHTQVQFQWNHLGFSNPGAEFDTIAGTLMWDAADIEKSSVDISIPVASVHSRVQHLDDKLKSAEYFDVRRFPSISFRSTRVDKTLDPKKLKVSGELSVHGVTRPVVLDVTLNRSGTYPMLNLPAAGFDASTTFKRSDFGVGAGVPLVSDDIRVHITVEAIEAEGYARAMKARADAAKKP